MAPTLLLSIIYLHVSKLEQSLRFYIRRLGFTVAEPGAERALLATDTGALELLELTEDSAAPSAERDAAGLFHAAVLLPTRAALGAWIKFATARGVAFDGLSDHGVSAALHLSDPDDNGLEVYADRPAAARPRDQAGITFDVSAG